MDAAFNLAQSLQTLGEWTAENGPSTSAVLTTTSRDAFSEARTLLLQLEVAQTAQLQLGSGPNTPISDMSGASTPTSANDTSVTETAEALEVVVITPSTVIETILSNVEVTLALLDSEGEAIFREVDSLLQRANQLNEKAHYMDSEIQAAKADAMRNMLEAQSEAGQSVEATSLISLAEKQKLILDSVRRPDPAKMSELADTLYSYAEIRARQGTSAIEELQKALEFYEAARTTLSSPLGRPASTPAHHVPALLSANWRSTAETFLLLAYLSAQQEHLQSAKLAALQALDITEGSIKTTASSSAAAPKFAKSLKATARQDYRTVAACREAILTMFRCFLHASESSGGLSDEVKQSLLASVKATWLDRADQVAALESYVQSCQNTAVWYLAQQTGNIDEGQMWSSFVQNL